jgi:propionyl-CoA synthetase
MTYADHYQSWHDDPDGFWVSQAQQLAWYTAPNSGLSVDEKGVGHWFADGVLNTCYLALDQHVAAGRGDQHALIYDSPVTGKIVHYSYRQLLDETSRVAGMLANLGVRAGDTVIIYMPMIPEAVMAMLACARIGAIHSVVFGGFAPPELASRIDDAKPNVILAASCGIEVKRIIEYKPMIDQAIALATHQPNAVVVRQRAMCNAPLEHAQDMDWDTLVQQATPVMACAVQGRDPLYILYTSGTTGKPKGVVRENGGHAVALKYSMQAVYGMQPGDVFWSASDVGWVVGHSYIVYGPLIQGCTTVLYEGKPVGTPDACAFWRVIEQHGVNALFSAPTAFRAIRREDPQATMMAEYDLSSLRTVFAAGERLDPATQAWMAEHIGVPIIDNWWQTETGWPIASNMMGVEALPVKVGSATKPIPGYDVRVLDEEGTPKGAGQQGTIAI